MSEAQFDQSAWFERIGYSGPVAPTLKTLNRLIFAHAHTISYETLDIMLGRPPKLDVPTLQTKMIAGKRGGYCFEQNMLFRAAPRHSHAVSGGTARGALSGGCLLRQSRADLRSVAEAAG